MTRRLHAHPFSSYCQKVLIALYETGTPFETVLLEGEARPYRTPSPAACRPTPIDPCRSTLPAPAPP